MQKQYRRDYDGEHVLVHTIVRDGEKIHEREWIENPISNQHISGRAAVIGSDSDMWRFDFKMLKNHRGGLLGNKRLQLYGANYMWRHMTFDFVVAGIDAEIDEINNVGYYNENIVYANNKTCMQNPGKFYNIPFSKKLNELAGAVYMAAFDGHNEVFLIGYNKDLEETMGTNWVSDVNTVFATYTDTKFHLVGTEANMYDQWKNNRNVSCLNYRDFVTYCDV